MRSGGGAKGDEVVRSGPRARESRREGHSGVPGPPRRVSRAAEANHAGSGQSKGGVTWAFKCLRFRDKVHVRLILFTHAGGIPTVAFHSWSDLLPEFVEAWVVDLHEYDAHENGLSHVAMNVLCSRIVSFMVKQKINVSPFALFGHSFGGLVAYATTVHLQEHSYNLPLALLISSHPAPCAPLPKMQMNIAELTDAVIAIRHLHFDKS